MEPQKASPTPSPVPQGQGGTELQSRRDTGSSDAQTDHTPLAGVSGPRAGCACARFRAAFGAKEGAGRARAPSPGNEKNRRPQRAPGRRSVEVGRGGLVWSGKLSPGVFPEQEPSARASGTRKGGQTWGQHLNFPRAPWTEERGLVPKAESPVGAPRLTLWDSA